jgi:isoleucyl-tRNA synthetase
MDAYKIHEALRTLKTFLVEDLSHTYIRYVRRRTWVEKRTRDKQVAYATLYSALKSALIMLTPITPFLTESIYQHMFRNAEPKNPDTVHLLEWPEYDSRWVSDSLEEEMKGAQNVISTVAVVRMGKGLKQRQPVPQVLVISESKTLRNALKTYAGLLRDQTNTRRLKLVSKDSLSQFTDSNRFAKTDFSEGTVLIDLKLSKSELAEGLARDAVRRMQQMRKEMDLKVDSFVHAYVVAPSKKEASLLKMKNSYIAGEIRAKQLKITTGETKVLQPYYTKRWQIDGMNFEFGLCETSKLSRKTTTQQRST